MHLDLRVEQHRCVGINEAGLLAKSNKLHDVESDCRDHLDATLSSINHKLLHNVASFPTFQLHQHIWLLTRPVRNLPLYFQVVKTASSLRTSHASEKVPRPLPRRNKRTYS
jgi:hypothetical protein